MVDPGSGRDEYLQKTSIPLWFSCFSVTSLYDVSTFQKLKEVKESISQSAHAY